MSDQSKVEVKVQERVEEELSVEELEDAAGGGLSGANTNCSFSCPTNVNCATICGASD
jgi:hypothetical protein